MNLFQLLISLFRVHRGDAEMLDHVPVQGDVAKLAKARKVALKRHGKPFHTDVKKERETLPSRELIDLRAAQRKQESLIELPPNVEVITKAKKK